MKLPRHSVLGPWLLVGFIVCMVLLAVLAVDYLAKETSEPPLTVAPPAWMDQVTSACDEFGVRIYAYNGVPFAATRGVCGNGVIT